MYTKEDVGTTVYLPQWGEQKCTITDFDNGGNHCVEVTEPSGYKDHFTVEGVCSEGELPILSRTPWTQRAVTEKPWEPEVGELVILPQGLVGQVIKIDPKGGDMKFQVFSNGVSIYWEVSQLLQFSKDSAEQAIYPTLFDESLGGKDAYDQTGRKYELTIKDGCICAFCCGHYYLLDPMGKCLEKELVFTLEPPKQ